MMSNNMTVDESVQQITDTIDDETVQQMGERWQLMTLRQMIILKYR